MCLRTGCLSWNSWGNHLFLLGAVGYLFADFLPDIFEEAHVDLRRQSVGINFVYLLLAATFVVDAVCYALPVWFPERFGEEDLSTQHQMAQLEAGGEQDAFVPHGHFRRRASTDAAFVYGNFPLPQRPTFWQRAMNFSGIAETFNLIPSSLYLISAAYPFLRGGDLYESIAEYRDTHEVMNWIESAAMFLFILDSFLYLRAWFRDRKQQIRVGGVHSVPVVWKDWYFWANFLNIFGSLLYLVASAVGLVMLDKLESGKFTRRDLIDAMEIQAWISVAGDCIYVLDSIVLELAAFTELLSESETSSNSLSDPLLYHPEIADLSVPSLSNDEWANSML